jgi:hypothetical protein
MSIRDITDGLENTMSTIKLTSFFTYNASNVPKQVILNNVPMPKSVSAPEGTLATFYGFHDTLAGLAKWRRDADRTGQGFCSVELMTEIGTAHTINANPENISETKFLNFSRMTRALEDKIIDYWKGYLKEEGMSDEALKTYSWRNLNYVMERPDLLNRLRQEEEFKHLDVMVYQVREDDGNIQQKASIFNRDAIVQVNVIDNPEIEVLLPRIGPQVEKKMSPRM